MLPDDRHGDDRYIVMQDIVEAAEADGDTVERTWQNMADTIQLVFDAKLKSTAWAPKT
jgi:hypothetical protein